MRVCPGFDGATETASPELAVDILAYHVDAVAFEHIPHLIHIVGMPWVSGVCIASIVTIRTKCSWQVHQPLRRWGGRDGSNALDSGVAPGSF